jgi:aryl-alcohol dehydrogenase-like predicted oxidoreductase
MNVDRVILGCGNFGGIGSDLSLVGRGDGLETAFELMDRAWDRGVRRFDTASSYGGGRSEQTIGAWIRDRRPEGLALTTKVFHRVHEHDDSGLAPARVKRVLHESLERLGVDRVEQLLVHEPDPNTPVAETMAAFSELVDEGTVGAIGVSNVDGDYLRAALEHAPVSVVQNEYSLLARGAETEVLPLCVQHGLRFEVFSPLAGGWLTGKYRRGARYPDGSRMTLRPEPYAGLVRDDVFTAVEELERRGDPATLALAWLCADPHVAGVVVGPRRVEHLEPVWNALGTPVSLPVLAAPVALQRLAHDEGEAATARGVAAAGTIMVLSTSATLRPGAVAAAAPGAPRWFQVYVFKDRERTQALIDEACAHGYEALVLTIDTPILGRREGAIRIGFGVPDGLETAGDIFRNLDSSLSWRDLEWLAGHGLPVVLKGVLTREDAKLALEHGAGAVVVSNHGGRQLDGVSATIDALPEVAEAIGGAVDVLLDSGVRRGVDVLRALALGARATLVGRPVVHALAVDGAAGVERLFGLLRDEIALGLQLIGCTSPAQVTREHVEWRA